MPKPSIDQIKKLYIKGAEKELNKTEFPIKYSIKSMEEETSRGVKPDLSQDGLFQLKKIPEKELMIRNSKGCSTKQNFIFLINKITKNKITDPEFEKTQIYD